MRPAITQLMADPVSSRPHGDLSSTTIFDTVAGELAPSTADGQAAAPASVFDVCHGGVALRTVLFVHGVIAIGLAFGSADPRSWFLDVAMSATVALPATLLWLICACLVQRRLGRLSVPLQWAAAALLGAASAAAGWLWMAWLGAARGGAMYIAAHMMAGAAMAAGVFHWLRLRARMQLPATTAARLAELQSRIRPHFLFNALNSAIALVRVDPARAEDVLEALSELFRSALIDTGQHVSLGDELELARRYLDIEQVRFGRRLSVQWDLDPQANRARLPPLALQPLVENAVKHGVEPSDTGGVVRIRTGVRNGQAVVVVTNTLPQQASQPGHGIGLRNVRDRLRLLHDVAAHFQAGVTQPKHGEAALYRVSLSVPL